MNLIAKRFLLIAFLWMGSIFAEDCPTMLKTPDEIKALGEIRLKAIKGWDKLLTWALSPKNTTYPLQKPLEQKSFQVKAKDLSNFDENYGYFSIYHPIVGIVTKNDRDTQVTQCLLSSLPTEIKNLDQLHFSTQEILAKVMAYRRLKKGMKISMAMQSDELVTYIVDEVIDLWRGMPAFGLVPEKKGEASPILLFRGTDLDLTSERGWASILSDLDTTGPGHVTFLRAQKQIHAWLKKMDDQKMPAIASGFSLGGVFTIYTLIYEHELLNKEVPSIAFNSPGIASEILEKWHALTEEQKPPHAIYVNQGDFVSQIGLFPSNVWEVTIDHPMEVIEAHVTLISAQPSFKLNAVDIEKLNINREN